MGYNAKLASTTDFGVVKVGTGLNVTNGMLEATLGLLNYGFVTSSVTQTNPVASAVNLATFDAVGPANGVSVVGGNAITVVNAGTYTKLFTLSLNKTSGGSDIVSMWLRVNGVDVPGSRQEISLTTSVANLFISGNFTLDIPAGGNIQVCWSSADTTVSLIAQPASVTPTRPAGFSIKVTLTRISQ